MTFLTQLRTGFLAVLAAFAFAFASATPAPAASEGRDTAAVAVNDKDGSTLFDFAFSIQRLTGEVVDNQNVALAYATCQECRTVAISVQILLVEGSPDTVTPTNLAVALNEECSSCQTVASAYQFVFGVDDRFRFTSDGLREIARIRREFRRLRKERDLSTEELQARSNALANDLRTVLRNEITAKPDRDDRDDRDERDDDDERGDEEDDDRPDGMDDERSTGDEGDPSAADGTTEPSTAPPGEAPGEPAAPKTTPTQPPAQTTPAKTQPAEPAEPQEPTTTAPTTTTQPQP